MEVSCEFNPDENIRFDFSLNSSERVFDDPQMEREYQTLIADSDEEVVNYSADSDVEFLRPNHRSSDDDDDDNLSFSTPRASKGFLRTKSDEESLSDLDISKKKAQTIFSRKRIIS